MVTTYAVFAIYGACVAAARDHVVSRPVVLRWFRGSFAAAFVLLGVRLALAER